VKRPPISPKTMVNVAINQALEGTILCPLCWDQLAAMDDRILEHLVPYGLDGKSDETNLRWVHKECASKKTNGSKATSAGGDLHKIAKAKRLAKARDELKAVLSGEKTKQPGSIKSRGFDKTWRKTFSGKTEKRT